MSRSLTFCLKTKMPWRQTPSRKKKSVVFTTVTTDAYQDQLNAGVSKVCEIFKFHGIESLKYVREFCTPVCYYGDISTPRNVTLNETNCDWLLDMSVKRHHGRALTNENCHLFQTFSRQSEGLATRDYHDNNTVHVTYSDILYHLKSTIIYTIIKLSNFQISYNSPHPPVQSEL